MTFNYENVYIENTSTIAGPYEKKGPLKDYFDKTFDNLYYKEKTWEKAETRLLNDSINLLLNKSFMRKEDIDLVIAGDLLNQITPSCFGVKDYEIPFLGIFAACATVTEGMIIASDLIDSKRAKNIIISTSSHNMTAEKQFRNPTEYGAIKTKTATFTATGAASILLTNKKTNLKITSSTIGKIVDYKQKDPFNMGAAMAPAAADTIYSHLKNTKTKVEDYDLILTGDLGKYGKKLLKEIMWKKYNIDLKNIHKDCGLLLYDLNNQKDIKAGGSGPVCSPLVVYSKILNQLKNKEIKRILMVSTGALFSPISLFQKENILGIAHAVCMEVE